MEASINALNERTTFAYDDSGAWISVQNAQGNLSTSVYDEVGRTLASVNPLNQRTTLNYDAAGRQISTRVAKVACQPGFTGGFPPQNSNRSLGFAGCQGFWSLFSDFV